MSKEKQNFQLDVQKTKGYCPIGETVGMQNLAEGKMPVISCEGACIRGEIARQAAHMVAKDEDYRRGCHGEFFSVPESAMAEWMNESEKVVMIDGCFLKCHGRILENLIGEERMIHFDALGHYKKYNDLFEIDDVPEAERMTVARDVADWVLAEVKKPTTEKAA